MARQVEARQAFVGEYEMPKDKWTFSTDEECYPRGEFASREEAIEAISGKEN